MKTKIKISTLFILCLGMTSVKGQETITKDPLLQFKKFSEIGIAVNATRVNTNYTEFKTDNGNYSFEKTKYLPTIDACFNYGWLLKDKEENSIMTIKTGLNLISRNADLKDSLMNNLRFSSGYIQIPIQFGFRTPLKYNTVKNNLFRAFEFNAGLYGAIPILEKLDARDNIDASGTSLFGNYVRFGFLGEIVFSALNEKGQGHKFGIRASRDFNSILKIKDTKSDLYPYYYTIGLFYNITNTYK